MSTATTTRFGAELRAICGAANVVDDPALLRGRQVLGVVPSTVVTPASADEAAAVLRVDNENGLSVVPAGGFTAQNMGRKPAQVDVLLSTSRLRELEHYDAADLTIGVGAGWTVADLAAKVAADNLFFPGDPALPERATVGGLLATGFCGPHRQGYGGLRDYCIGIRFVTGDGHKAKGGGRVVKNVAGYDMMKLLIGSYGTLGVITSASFKLFPAPRQTRTFIAEFSGAVEAVQFRNQVLRSPLDPICLELVSPGARQLLHGFGSDGPWLVLLRAAGSDPVLARYRAELGSAVARELEGINEREAWRALSNFSHTVEERCPQSLLLSLQLPLREVGPILQQLATVSASLKHAVIGRFGAGHLLVALWQPSGSTVQAKAFADAIAGLHHRLPIDASMAVLSCPPEVRADIAWIATPTHVESMRVVKKVLDPNDTLNHGRFLF